MEFINTAIEKAKALEFLSTAPPTKKTIGFKDLGDNRRAL